MSDGADDRGIRGRTGAAQSPWPSITAFGPFHLHSSALNTRPSCGLHAEHVEEVVRHRHAAQALGLAAAAEQVVADAVEREVAGDRRQRLRALAQIQHVPDLRRLPGQSAGVAVGDPDQCCGSAKGSGRSSSVLTTLKTVALAPMPRPAIRMAKVVKPASRRSVRAV